MVDKQQSDQNSQRDQQREQSPIILPRVLPAQKDPSHRAYRQIDPENLPRRSPVVPARLPGEHQEKWAEPQRAEPAKRTTIELRSQNSTQGCSAGSPQCLRPY